MVKFFKVSFPGGLGTHEARCPMKPVPKWGRDRGMRMAQLRYPSRPPRRARSRWRSSCNQHLESRRFEDRHFSGHDSGRFGPKGGVGEERWAESLPAARHTDAPVQERSQKPSLEHLTQLDQATCHGHHFHDFSQSS